MTIAQITTAEPRPLTGRDRQRAARRQASIHRKAELIRAWLAAQQTDPPQAARWVCVYGEVAPWPSWWRGGTLVGADVVEAVELLADQDYLVRRVERAGDRVRRVEVVLR